jgi:hypothetical protein
MSEKYFSGNKQQPEDEAIPPEPIKAKEAQDE